MINSLLPKALPKILDPAFTKTMCAYKAYKDYSNIAQFWHQKSKDGDITAIISSINGYVNLWCDENADKNELRSFLEFLSPAGVFTGLDTAKALKLKINEECLVFVKEPPFEALEDDNIQAQPRELLECIRKGLEIPDGDGFVADVTFRKYHNCAEYTVKDGGGALLFLNNSTAIINGISTPKESRGKGLGSILLKQILSKAGNRTVFACCIKKNKEFYLKNGFSYVGNAAYCEEK